MSLQIHNTLNRRKEVFEPLKPDAVGLYVCGPTVYDYAHIGNARPVVVFDVLARLLRRLYPKVTYVRNITDVDDKIIAAAQSSGEPIDTITTRTAEAFHEDMAALGALPPDVEPRATGHIDQMIAMIASLIERGHAYEAEGHVLFSVPSMPDYGKLSGRNRDEQIAGARVEVAPYKRDAADFVLWKPSTDDQPGWDSPWGRGRPGWHIECSAMSGQYLGETFDIHGGGQDLIFPHHENEIAQSCCAHDAPFVRYWMHNGYLMVEGEKMSKSLGNFYTVHDLLKEFPGEAIRLVLLQTHYRQPLDFTKDKIKDAKGVLDRFYRALQEADKLKEKHPSIAESAKQDTFDLSKEVLDDLSDDLNTPAAIMNIHQLVGQIFHEVLSLDSAEVPIKTEKEISLIQTAEHIRQSGYLLGILQQDPEAWLRWQPEAQEGGLDDAAIEDLIEQREEARQNKDFATADRIRDDLAAQGVILEDGAGGTTWRRG